MVGDGLVAEIQSRLRREATALSILLIVGFLAKGGAFLPGYAIDDYPSAMRGVNYLSSDVLGKGRLGHWLWLKAAIALQLEPNSAHILYVVLAIAAYATFGLAVVRFWGARGRGWPSLAAAAVIANHPYTCEIFACRVGLPPAAIVMVLLAFILFLIARGGAWLLPGAAVFALAMSFYPIAFNFGVMIAILGLAIDLARSIVAATERPEGAMSPWVGWWGRTLKGRSIRLVTTIACGVLAYVALGFMLKKVLGVDDQYFSLLRLSELPGRLRLGSSSAMATLTGPNVLIPLAARASLVFVVGLTLASLLSAWYRKPPRWPGALAWGVIFTLLGLAFLWTIGLYLVVRIYWPVPRNMAHAAVWWGGCILLATLAVRASLPRRMLAVAVAIVVLSFIGASEQVFADQWQLNRRDAHLANRIVARLERQPGFPAVRRVVVVPGMAWYPAGPSATQWGDMNISAFGATWSQAEVLREASGYDFHPSASTEERDAAKVYCASVSPWPDRRSVRVDGELAVVCLGP